MQTTQSITRAEVSQGTKQFSFTPTMFTPTVGDIIRASVAARPDYFIEGAVLRVKDTGWVNFEVSSFNGSGLWGSWNLTIA